MTDSLENKDRPLRLVAVGCSGSKFSADAPMPARERYKGSYWVSKRRYGEQVSDGWRILSAEYGILHPDEKIPYYEKVPGDLRGVPVETDSRLPNGRKVRTELDQWAVDVHQGLVQWLQAATRGWDPEAVALEVLVGRKYRKPLAKRGVFDSITDEIPAETSISFPFQEVPAAQGGMFNQIEWMNSCSKKVAQSDDATHE